MALNSVDKRSILEEFMIAQNNKCYYCGVNCFIGTVEQRIKKDKYKNIATIEHLLPIGMSERNYKENLVMCCNKCNNELGDKTNPKYKIKK